MPALYVLSRHWEGFYSLITCVHNIQWYSDNINFTACTHMHPLCKFVWIPELTRTNILFCELTVSCSYTVTSFDNLIFYVWQYFVTALRIFFIKKNKFCGTIFCTLECKQYHEIISISFFVNILFYNSYSGGIIFYWLHLQSRYVLSFCYVLLLVLSSSLLCVSLWQSCVLLAPHCTCCRVRDFSVQVTQAAAFLFSLCKHVRFPRLLHRFMANY